MAAQKNSEFFPPKDLNGVNLMNPYGNLNEPQKEIEEFMSRKTAVFKSSSAIFGNDYMSPLPPQLKGTFVDKLPSWSETSKDVNSPESFLNVNGKKYVFSLDLRDNLV